MAIGKRTVVHLSLFAGIDVAALAVSDVFGSASVHAVWETDQDCLDLLAARFPRACLREDAGRSPARREPLPPPTPQPSANAASYLSSEKVVARDG